MGTLFTKIYDRFLGKITDDMYLELTPQDTLRDLRQLILDSIPGFEFPRKKLDFVLDMEVLENIDEGIYWGDISKSAVIDNPSALEWDGMTSDSAKAILRELSENEFLQQDSDNDGMEELIPETTANKDRVFVETSYFVSELTDEEINILALLMMCAWVQRQVTSIENTRMKYSGSDFKMTSQANHLSKLLTLLAETQRQSFHMQRLYKRRKVDSDGYIRSNWSVLRENSALDN